jgi:O-antigen/teichoic acid export membrane protein
MSSYLRNMWSMVGLSTVQRMLGMVTTIVLARLLGSASFGIYSIVANTSASAYGMVRFGVDATIHVHTAQHSDDQETRNRKGQLLGIGLVLLTAGGLLGGAFCILGASWLSTTIYGHPALAEWIRWAGILVIVQCWSQFCYALLAGFHRFQAYAKLMMAMSLLSLVVIILTSIMFGLQGAVVGFIAVQLVTLIGLAMISRSVLDSECIKLSLVKMRLGLKSIIETGMPFYLAGLVSVPTVYIVQGLLVKEATVEQIGGIRIISSIIALISFIPNSIAAVMISHFTRISTDNYAAFVDTMLSNLKIIWLFSLAVCAGVMVVLPLVVGLLFGAQYIRFVPAAYVAMFSAVLSLILGVIGNIVFSRNKVMFILGFTCIQMLTFVCMAYLTIPKYALIGYYTAELAGYLSALISIWLMTLPWRKRHQIAAPWVKKLVWLTAVFVFLGVINSFYLSDSLRIVFGLCVLTFIVLVGYRAILSKEENEIFLTKLNAIINRRLTS